MKLFNWQPNSALRVFLVIELKTPLVFWLLFSLRKKGPNWTAPYNLPCIRMSQIGTPFVISYSILSTSRERNTQHSWYRLQNHDTDNRIYHNDATSLLSSY